MLQKKSSTGFFVQISKILKDAGSIFTNEQDGTTTTMIDAENMIALRSKPFVLGFIAANRDIGVQQEAIQK